MDKENLLAVGKIIGSHGVRGEIKIFPLTDDIDRFKSLKTAFIVDENNTVIKDVICVAVKFVKNTPVLKFEGIDDRNISDSYKGKYLSVSRENAVKLTEDSYFICDIIGSKVTDISGVLIGELTDVIVTGANDVYVIKRPGKKDLLLPAIKKVIKSIDIDNKVIQVELIEGIEEIYQ